MSPPPPVGVTWTYEWTVTLRHCTSGCHAHQLTSGSGPSLTFVAPDHEYPTTIEVAVAATSSKGEVVATTRRLEPSTVVVNVDTSPSGGVVVDHLGEHATPYSFTMIRNGTETLTVPATQEFAAGTGTFSSWSPGGSATRSVSIAPSGNASMVAHYAIPGVCATQRLEAETATFGLGRDRLVRFGRRFGDVERDGADDWYLPVGLAVRDDTTGLGPIRRGRRPARVVGDGRSDWGVE